ncbi:S1C family serine protease, partial [Kroppenstedtia guangzhouensis]|uniref:S1C family serine protease n=1 Tax=Kroppenstedtia guangzhouensis TaxID=1274356 RepID=UPI00166BF058
MHGSYDNRGIPASSAPMKASNRRKGELYSLSANHPANSFVPVIRRVRNSVVAISAEEDNPPASRSLFNRLFNDFTPPDQEEQDTRRQYGSGFVISPKGYILTNEHVVRRAKRLLVHFFGRKGPLPARVVWRDFHHDLAVIQVRSSTPLKPLAMGSSRHTEVGEWAIAIGNP